MSDAEATMTKKTMKIRCKLKLPDKPFVLKRRHSDGDYGDDEEKVRRKKKRMIVKAPAIPPELPAKFKNHIESLNGIELNFVFEKSLYSTDLNHNQGRLSLPLSQIDNGFLTRKEKDLLETRTGNHKTSIEAKLIDPPRKESDIFLKKWDMPKKIGKVNSTYNLMTSWNDVVESNKQCEGMIVQLWSF
ncbi:B3 domain-containing protein At5g24050-like [Camellia sinensis]|uniref:B3 domain-containing protein At5g24050-like n=1 Tax=Camellia sinensis TaxID=4442 RepID=UPI001036AF7B|nr:B3 domain-containing protein At5g24050-like [Camellia sinensis]